MKLYCNYNVEFGDAWLTSGLKGGRGGGGKVSGPGGGGQNSIANTNVFYAWTILFSFSSSLTKL